MAIDGELNVITPKFPQNLDRILARASLTI